MTPDTRRAIRTTTHVIGALVMLVFLGWIIWKLSGDKTLLIGLGLVGILAIREVFHGAENVTARIKFKAGRDGFETDVDPEDRPE